LNHYTRHFFVQSDKETKQRKRFNRTTLSVHSVQFPFIGAPKARCSPEPPMFETLLLANPDIDTLRHQCSRANTLAKEPAPPHALARLRFLVARLSGLLSRGAWSASRITASCVFTASIFGESAGRLHGIRQLRPHAFWRPCFLVGWRRCGSSCVQIRWLVFPRIARGVLRAGSVTGGEARQNLCSEKEGFTHPPLWRAPCFWGTYEWELHAVDT